MSSPPSVTMLVESATLLLVLLNPFALTVYLLELVRALDQRTFALVVTRAALISAIVFCGFAIFGNAFFERVLQVKFAAFQIFGGILFLLIAIRFVLSGGQALESLRGAPAEHLAGAVAMPFMIGPGTVGASVVAGTRSGPMVAALSIVLSLSLTVGWLVVSKRIHDRLRDRNAKLVARYVDVVGRVTGLIIGTIAVEMLLDGWQDWHAARGR
jgi:multiple antibiotic resistance protein